MASDGDDFQRRVNLWGCGRIYASMESGDSPELVAKHVESTIRRMLRSDLAVPALKPMLDVVNQAAADLQNSMEFLHPMIEARMLADIEDVGRDFSGFESSREAQDVARREGLKQLDRVKAGAPVEPLKAHAEMVSEMGSLLGERFIFGPTRESLIQRTGNDEVSFERYERQILAQAMPGVSRLISEPMESSTGKCSSVSESQGRVDHSSDGLRESII